MDASGPDEPWEATRESLVKAVSANFHHWFQLDEASECEDCLTAERVSAGAMLAEFTARLREFSAPPFMLQRLTELAHLTHNASSQYKRHEGFKYLEAVLKTTRVRSSASVFDSFEAEFRAQRAEMRQGIELSSVPWLEGVDVDDALHESPMSLESPGYF